MKIVSVVPIKLNNTRLPGKNLKEIGGRSLVRRIQDTIDKISLINERYIFCSDESISNYIIPSFKLLKRSPELDKDQSNFCEIFTSFYQKVDADIYVYAHATAPFISQRSIELCINKVLKEGYDSAFTARKIQDFLWKDNKPLNFDPSHLPRSQDLPIIYQETSGVYVYTKEVFEKYKRRIGNNPFIHEVSFQEAIDINTKEDFNLAMLFEN